MPDHLGKDLPAELDRMVARQRADCQSVGSKRRRFYDDAVPPMAQPRSKPCLVEQLGTSIGSLPQHEPKLRGRSQDLRGDLFEFGLGVEPEVPLSGR